jgi:hypothetical protein
MAPVTDAVPAVMSPDDMAAAVRVIVIRVIIVRVIGVIRRSVEEVPAMMPERETAMAKAAAAEEMTGAKAAAMEGRAATSEGTAVKGCAAAMETSATMETATPTTVATATAVATTATMTAAAADFGHQSVRGVLRCRHGSRIDRRQRLGAPTGCGRQRQHRDSRKAQAADKAAPTI